MEPRPNTIEDNVRPDLGMVLKLDEQARWALLHRVAQGGLLDPAMARLASSLAISSLASIPAHIERCFPDARSLSYAVSRCVENPLWGGMYYGHPEPSQAVLTVVKAPDHYLLLLIEQSFKLLLDDRRGPHHRPSSLLRDLRSDVDGLLRGAGGDYVRRDDDTIAPPDDSTVLGGVLEPVLQVFGASELALVERDFRAALDALRRPGPEALRGAVSDAGAAVEGMLLVLRGDFDLDVTRKTTPAASFRLLQEHGVIPNHMEFAVLAAAQIRNKESAHSSQGTPRAPDLAIARASVFGAAIAISYLAGLRPSPTSR